MTVRDLCHSHGNSLNRHVSSATIAFARPYQPRTRQDATSSEVLREQMFYELLFCSPLDHDRESDHGRPSSTFMFHNSPAV